MHKHGNSTHGESGTPLYQSWINMRRRCYTPAQPGYENYGGRGITVYEPWIDSYEAFREYVNEHLGSRPLGWTLDRIENNGHYEPGNVRWASRSQQATNQRRGPRGPYNKASRAVDNQPLEAHHRRVRPFLVN